MSEPTPRFATILAKLHKVFPGELDEVFAEVYWDALSDVPIEWLEAGAKDIIKFANAGEFYPKPGDLRQAANDIRSEAMRRRRAIPMPPWPGPEDEAGREDWIKLHDKRKAEEDGSPAWQKSWPSEEDGERIRAKLEGREYVERKRFNPVQFQFQPPKPAEAMTAVYVPTVKLGMTDEDWEARRAALKAQAEELMAADKARRP